jgi:hypothetical protein
MGDQSSSDSSSWLEAAKDTSIGKRAAKYELTDYANLRKAMALQYKGGAQDISRARTAQNQFANLMQQYAQTGGMPQVQDINNANQFANQMFAPQQTALQQAFEQQRMMANRQAGVSGRMANDPILANKLAQGQTQQQALLQSQQGAFAAQYAQQLPGQRVNAMQQYAGLREGLASQALQNRSTLLSLGSQLKGAERQWRVQTGIQHGSQSQSSGGGLGGAIGGALGGAATGLMAFNAFGGPSKTVGDFTATGGAPTIQHGAGAQQAFAGGGGGMSSGGYNGPTGGLPAFATRQAPPPPAGGAFNYNTMTYGF